MSIGCNGYLQKFLDEDKPLVLTLVSDTTSTAAVNVQNRTLAFAVTFSIDRAGQYQILHGTSCSTGKAPAGVTLAGGLTANTQQQVNVTIALDDIAAYGSAILICAGDTANYQTASQAVAFTKSINEQTGRGLNFSNSLSANFVFFQNDWVSGTANRGGAGTNNGVNQPHQHTLFVDPNDGYKIKYFVVDTLNHRVLIFNTIPANSSAAADVIIGQSATNAFTANAGGTTSNAGFNTPSALAVSATGRLYVTDRLNNRVLGYNAIPQSNGATADFVIGQPNMAGNTANNGGLAVAQQLNDPTGISIYQGKLYLIDRGDNRVLVFNTLPTGNSPTADMAIGQANTASTTSGVDYSSISNYLTTPYEVLFDAGKMYLTDGGNHRVLVFNVVPNVADARPDFVIGHNGPSPASANCGYSPLTISLIGISQCLSSPRGLAIQGSKLAVADMGNNRVVFFDLPITAVFATAQQVLGQPGMYTYAAATSASALSAPRSLVFDNGYIWITDSTNNRAVVWALPY